MKCYENFIMRLHNEKNDYYNPASRESWSVRLREGVLQNFVVGDVTNPYPETKSEVADIPGMNGVIDATEANGNVFYKNKTVTVILQGEASEKWFGQVERELSAYSGRVVDFAFEDSLSVEYYHIGRMRIASIDPYKNRITLEFDTRPFMRAVESKSVQVPVSTSIDRSASGWSVESNPNNAVVVLNNSHIFIWGNVGDTVYLQRNATAGKQYTMAVDVDSGCDYTFLNLVDGVATEHKVLGIPNAQAKVRLKVTLNGSSYNWTEESTPRFLAFGEIDYTIAELETSGDEVSDNCKVTLPSNVWIRPDIFNDGDEGVLLLNGWLVRVWDTNGNRMRYPVAILPGINGNREAAYTDCYITSVGVASQDVPAITLEYWEERLG